MIGELYPGEFEAMEHNGRMDALEQEPCEDWHDVPSDEMTLGQARQAVKDLRKKLAEYLWQTPCEDAISRRAVEKITWEEPSYSDALNVLTEVRDKVRALPPVNPQPNKEDIHREREQAYMRGFEDGSRKYRTAQSEEK